MKVVFTPQKGGRHNLNFGESNNLPVVFTPQKGGRHNHCINVINPVVVVFTPQKGGRHNGVPNNIAAEAVVFTPQKGGNTTVSLSLPLTSQLFLPLKKEVTQQIVCFPRILWVFLSIFI